MNHNRIRIASTIQYNMPSRKLTANIYIYNNNNNLQNLDITHENYDLNLNIYYRRTKQTKLVMKKREEEK